jgi:membrane protein
MPVMAEARTSVAGAGAARTPGGHDTPGGQAVSPGHIPVRGWLRILRRATRHVMSDRLQVASAGISFFAVLSIAPLLVTALSVYGALHTPEQVIDQLTGMAGALPDPLEPVVEDQLVSITEASTQVLTVRGLLGLAVALWTATTAATFLVDALTLAYHEHESRSFLRRSGLALVVVLGGAVVLGAVIALSGMLARVMNRGPAIIDWLGEVLVWPGLALLMIGVLDVLYRVGPDRKEARWRWISGGAVLATLLWLVLSGGFFAYVQTLGDYESTYGSLAGVAISMFWVWVTVFLVIVGAAVNAEAERQTVRDTTVGPERPLGERGAVVADSAPPYPGEE